MTNVISHSCVCLSSLGKCLFKSFARFLIEWYVLLLLSLEVLYIVWVLTLITGVICKYFLPISELPFYAIYSVHLFMKVFNFDEVRFVSLLLLLLLVPLLSHPRNLNPKSWNVPPIFFFLRVS